MHIYSKITSHKHKSVASSQPKIYYLELISSSGHVLMVKVCTRTCSHAHLSVFVYVHPCVLARVLRISA